MGGYTWPGGHRGALALTFDVDAESAILAVDPAYAARLTTMSHQAYGPKVGVPRILRMLERTGVRGSFFVPGLTADRYPGTVEAILAAGPRDRPPRLFPRPVSRPFRRRAAARC